MYPDFLTPLCKVQRVTTFIYDTPQSGFGMVWEVLWVSKNSVFVRDILEKSVFQEIAFKDPSETLPRRVQPKTAKMR